MRTRPENRRVGTPTRVERYAGGAARCVSPPSLVVEAPKRPKGAMQESELSRRGTEPARGEADERVGGTAIGSSKAGAEDGRADEASAGMDAAGFARATAKHGSEAGLAGGGGDPGGDGDLSGSGGLDEEGDEGKPA
jgi:hypothetical protein